MGMLGLWHLTLFLSLLLWVIFYCGEKYFMKKCSLLLGELYKQPQLQRQENTNMASYFSKAF